MKKPTLDDVWIRRKQIVAMPASFYHEGLFELATEPASWMPNGVRHYWDLKQDAWENVALGIAHQINAERIDYKEGVRELAAGLAAGDRRAESVFRLRKMFGGQPFLDAMEQADEPPELFDGPVPVSFLHWYKDQCQVCGREIMATTHKTTKNFCSQRCAAHEADRMAAAHRHRDKLRKRAKRAKDRTRQCHECGETFIPKRSDAITCSQKCRQRRSYRLSQRATR